MDKMLAILALALLATTAVAQEPSGSENASAEATEKMREHLEKAEPEEHGIKEAPGGGAKPTENWFGCPPDDADDVEGDEQEGCEEMSDDTGDEEDAS